MSRLGKRPITLNAKVKTDYKDRVLKVKGPVGEMNFTVPVGIDLDIKKDVINIVADFETAEGRMMGGTIRSIINNMVLGVSEGFTRVLNLVGVGYRAKVSGQKLTLSLGYSHPIDYKLPKIVKADVDANTKITLVCCDKQVLGQTTAEIRKYRPPEPYKGKGILYEGEIVKKKAGKAAKATV